MELDRRQFLKAAAIGGGVAAIEAMGTQMLPGAPPDGQGRSRRTGNPIAVSTYSFWQFRGQRPGIPDCIERAAALGFDGVEILLVQMHDESNATLQKLKRQAHSLGLALVGFSTHQGFVSPDPGVRRANVKKTIAQIEIAYRLGIPTMRINTGRWGTLASFDELMVKKGIEPPLPGHTEEEAFGWVIESIEALLPKAEECGVVLGLENHWGLGRTAAGVLRIVEAIRSPWLGMTLDTGNFLERPYEQFAQMLGSKVPVALVQAKTYFGGGRWYALDLDYGRIAALLREHGYRGWISLEYEGNDESATAVPRSLELLRKYFS
jgi:sugar phosphate isomerase/epimerase